MLIHVNCLGRSTPADVGPVLAAVTEAVSASDLDTDRLIVNLDWVQYKRNFREPVTLRRFMPVDGDGPRAEVVIDMRRVGSIDLPAAVQRAIRGAVATELSAEPAASGQVLLEEYRSPVESIIWAFNRNYWEHLSSWEATFKKDYVAALPGGASDGTHPDFWRDRVSRFVDVLERLEARQILPAEIYVVEFGVGSGQQARMWLDTFQRVCAERGHGYYNRLLYLMTDYSRDVLQTARRTVEMHRDRVSSINIDAADPLEALAFLRYKVLFVHSCNLYDNLPTDAVVRVAGRAYRSLVRAYVDGGRARAICEDHGVAEDEFVATVQRVLRFGPDALGDEKTGVLFWSDVWDAVRLDEVFEEIHDPAAVRLAPIVDLRLADVLGDLPDTTRVSLSSTALRSFVNGLSLLHPEGTFQVQDIFVRDLAQYGAFRGPGKMDGSIVNWVNGPLFRAIAERLGFHVLLEPFTYREGSNTVVLSTRPKD
jgi:hypothetical protein